MEVYIPSLLSVTITKCSNNLLQANQRLKDLTTELHLLVERFQACLQTPDVDLFFSKLPELFAEIDDRTNLRKRLREDSLHARIL